MTGKHTVVLLALVALLSPGAGGCLDPRPDDLPSAFSGRDLSDDEDAAAVAGPAPAVMSVPTGAVEPPQSPLPAAPGGGAAGASAEGVGPQSTAAFAPDPGADAGVEPDAGAPEPADE